MTRTVRLLFVLMAIMCFYHCNQENRDFELSIRINPFVCIQWNNRIMITKLGELQKIDTLELSDREINFVKNLYIKNKMYEFHGDKEFYEKLPVMPPSNLIISVGVKEKNQANITISDRLTPSSDLETNRIIRFRNDLMKVLENNESYQKGIYRFQELIKANIERGFVR